MKFTVSPSAYSASFPMPCDAVDKHIRLAGAVQLKVLLAAFRNSASGIDSEEISVLLSVPKPDVEDALRYWVSAGILNVIGEEPVKAAQEPKKAIPRAVIKPTREEIARRGSESAEVTFLLREAQNKFGRGLKTSEASTLLWLYDDEGMDAALILMLLEYAASEGRCTVSFIERTASDWIKNGVTDIVSAEAYIAETAKKRSAWRIVQNAFGIDKRQPSENELKTADIWINEYKFTSQMLKLAYDKCVDTTSKFSMPYVKKIIEKWHKAGYTTPEDIKEDTPKRTKGSYSASNLDEIEKMLDSE